MLFSTPPDLDSCKLGAMTGEMRERGETGLTTGITGLGCAVLFSTSIVAWVAPVGSVGVSSSLLSLSGASMLFLCSTLANNSLPPIPPPPNMDTPPIGCDGVGQSGGVNKEEGLDAFTACLSALLTSFVTLDEFSGNNLFACDKVSLLFTVVGVGPENSGESSSLENSPPELDTGASPWLLLTLFILLPVI
ncbi:hypothetical protein E2C01_037299 [Portunus trituberculatus]|uniref:Uncharacterized protein n=1 Tax=Portunus trituberculatus TaxID=210409 RepID=A0A5B7FEA2_PORTR|nr:hypothetical protein [Portunus trituberculatus]